MNDLQLTLLIVGGGAIVGMIAYNWWQDFRVRKQATERFGESEADPLFENGRTEPGLSALPAEQAESGIEASENQPETGHEKRLFADLTVVFENDVEINSLKPLADGLEQNFNKKILISLSPENCEEHSDTVWFKAKPYTGCFKSLRISLQLANRKGSLTSIEFSNLLGKIRRFAEEKSGHISFPEMKEVVSKAETLDQAAAALDTLLGLHCMLPEEVPEPTVVDMLAAAGWTSKGHQWHLASEEGKLATMVVHRAPGKRLLSFNIDVPNSADPLQALGDIVTVCHGFNEQFGAPLIDDSGTTLTTEAIQEIYEHLLERVRNLTDSGFKPGSSPAQLLFS